MSTTNPLDDDCLSVVLEYIGDPVYDQLSGWEGAGEQVAGRIWQEIRDRPRSTVGALVNSIDYLPLASSEKLNCLAERVEREFEYRNKAVLAISARDTIRHPEWAQRVDTLLRQLDCIEVESVLRMILPSVWGTGDENLARPTATAFPPARVQAFLEKHQIADRVSVADVHKFVEFVRNHGGGTRLQHDDIAYLKSLPIQRIVKAYFREKLRSISNSFQFPSLLIRTYDLDQLIVQCPLPPRFPPNRLRALYLRGYEELQLPDAFFDGMGLEELYLDRNRMTTLPRLGSLPRLEKFYAIDQAIAALPESLGDLPNLREIRLENNRLVTVARSFFHSLPSLQRIDLRENPLMPDRINAPRNVEVLRDGLPNNILCRGEAARAGLFLGNAFSRIIRDSHQYPFAFLGILMLLFTEGQSPFLEFGLLLFALEIYRQTQAQLRAL